MGEHGLGGGGAVAACEAAAPWRDRWPPMLAEMGL
jgi:hypothetical protein